MQTEQSESKSISSRLESILHSKALLIAAIITLILLVAFIVYAFVLKGDLGSVSLDLLGGSSEIIPAPVVEDEIKGFWSSRGVSMLTSELKDIDEMKEMEINTITFSPSLTHTQEGLVKEGMGTESQTKKAINKIHEAGIRVMLETTPMNAGEVDPKVTDVPLFQEEMTRVSLKYAAIAEEYSVAYFAPIVEPAHHMSVEEADIWLQELLPKLREVYSGQIMWKKQSMHLTDLRSWDEDHVMELGFKQGSSNTNVRMKSGIDHNVSLSINLHQISLSEYGEGREIFSKTELFSLDQSVWHTLRIEMDGKMIRISVDGQLLLEHEDDGGPTGGYAISSDDLRINKFEIRKMNGDLLLEETFETLNNWNAQKGWVLEGGEIVATNANDSGLIYDVDYSGYDYIAIDTFKRGQVETNQKYVDFLEFVVDKTNDQAKSDGVPNVIIAEFGGSIEEIIGWIDVDERAKIPMTEAELAEVTQMVLDMAVGKVDGFMYNGWDIEGQGLNQMPMVKEVIKDWYLSH